MVDSSSSSSLFKITTANLETGLRGVPVGYCPTSRVDPQKGLFYGSYSIVEASQWAPEEVIYLLYKGKRGEKKEIEEFSRYLSENATVSEAVIQQIYQLPRQGDPMKLFSIALLLLGIAEGRGDYREDCLQLIAKIPHLTAAIINHHAGWGKTPPPEAQRGYVERFVRMLRLPQALCPELIEVFRLFSILHYDHGGGNLSTFVGKAVASGLADMYSSMAAAMDALSGIRHGSANQEGLSLVKEALADVGKQPTEESIEAFIEKKLAHNELIYGFGHAVLRMEDPRAALEYGFAEKHYPDDPLVRVALLLRRVVPRILGKNPKISDPYANIDAISGTLLSAAGFAYVEYFSLLFGYARTVGISIQTVYERCEARQGKGTPIIRPSYIYLPR